MQDERGMGGAGFRFQDTGRKARDCRKEPQKKQNPYFILYYLFLRLLRLFAAKYWLSELDAGCRMHDAGWGMIQFRKREKDSGVRKPLRSLSGSMAPGLSEGSWQRVR